MSSRCSSTPQSPWVAGTAGWARPSRAPRGPAFSCSPKPISASAEQFEAQLEAARKLAPFDEDGRALSHRGVQLEGFYQAVVAHPARPALVPPRHATDQPLEVHGREFVREKILRSTFDEVPHAVGVVVEEMELDAKRDLTRIWAVIYVERDSQKGIIIGKRGEMIKKVGSEARTDLERLLGTRVHLELTVKVKKDWRRDASQIRRFGYGEGL